MKRLLFIRTIQILIGFSLLDVGPVFSATLYVDNQLASNCSGNYSVANRNCTGNDGVAFASLAGAAAVAQAGDTVLIRAGIYSEQLAPQHSGMPGLYIIFTHYADEKVILTGASLSPAIWLEEKSYIRIDGLEITNVSRWLACLGSHHNIFQNNIFRHAHDSGGSSKTGLFFQNADYNQILNNIIDSTTQDNIGMVQSDYNLIQGNTITRAAHTLWAIKCGSYNVIRKNYFHNAFQKIGEIYDCDGVGYGTSAFPKLSALDETHYNVVEDNVFAYTHTPIDASPYAGIQYAAQHGIIRRNLFYHCTGMPVSLTLYGDEATYNYGNRIYHNVMYDNHFGAIEVPASSGSYTCTDNTVRNNIFYKNNFIQYDFRWDWYDLLDGKPMQIMIGRSSTVLDSYTTRFDHNNIFSDAPDELFVIAYGDRTSSSNPPPETLSWWEANYDYFVNNLEADPMFVDTLNKDFQLQPGSPMIDAGRFLAKTVGSGSSSVMMKVDSAGYFMDGFGISGLSGDTIQLEGQTQRAVIICIDYVTNTLILDKPLSWNGGQGVSLQYEGATPDIGAFEFPVSTSVQERELVDGRIDVFPNPGKGKFFIRPSALNVTSLQVYNVLGECVFDSDHLPEFIDLSGQPAGMYILKAGWTSGEQVEKIMMEK